MKYTDKISEIWSFWDVIFILDILHFFIPYTQQLECEVSGSPFPVVNLGMFLVHPSPSSHHLSALGLCIRLISTCFHAPCLALNTQHILEKTHPALLSSCLWGDSAPPEAVQRHLSLIYSLIAHEVRLTFSLLMGLALIWRSVFVGPRLLRSK